MTRLTYSLLLTTILFGCETLGFTMSEVDVEAEHQLEQLDIYLEEIEVKFDDLTDQQVDNALACSKRAEAQFISAKKKNDPERLEHGKRYLCVMKREIGYDVDCDRQLCN